MGQTVHCHPSRKMPFSIDLVWQQGYVGHLISWWPAWVEHFAWQRRGFGSLNVAASEGAKTFQSLTDLSLRPLPGSQGASPVATPATAFLRVWVRIMTLMCCSGEGALVVPEQNRGLVWPHKIDRIPMWPGIRGANGCRPSQNKKGLVHRHERTYLSGINRPLCLFDPLLRL